MHLPEEPPQAADGGRGGTAGPPKVGTGACTRPNYVALTCAPLRWISSLSSGFASDGGLTNVML
jgi:hypothetical protein